MPWKNPEARREWRKKRRAERPDIYRAQARRYRERHLEKCREKVRVSVAKRRAEHPEECRVYRNAWNRKNRATAEGRLEHSIRNRIRMAVKRNSKAARTVELLGCSIRHLKVWLTFYFIKPGNPEHAKWAEKYPEGMTWANYGKVWHIDHVRPCASFNLADAAQQKECFHYTNLQPLFAEDNLRKSKKFVSIC